MSWISNLFRRGGDTRRIGSQTTKTVKTGTVEFDTAMTVSACWAATRLLTEAVAAMPLKCVQTDLTNNTRTPVRDNALWWLMNYKPNRYQTRTEFFESLMLNLVMRGNCYAAITRMTSGEIISLLPLPTAQMDVLLLDDGTKTFVYKKADGSTHVYAEESIWHVQLFGNGVTGLSPLQYSSKALTIATDLEDRMTVLASNGGKTNGILTIDEVLKPNQREQVKKNFAGLTEGNTDELFVLEAGMKYQSTSLSPSDMQMIENRKFSVEDIARFYGVPSVLINDTSGSTTWGSGIAEINQGFYKLNLRPYLERFESSIKRHLMPESDWETIDIEFDFTALLRADVTTRLDSQGKAINSGQLTPNEARAKDGLPPKDGGDTLYLQGALVPAGTQSMQTTTQGANNGA